MSEWRCASNLISINKKDGGIRPIAVGNTLHRVVGKAVLRIPDTKEQVSSLHPGLCGVGVPYACEMVIMGVQALAHTRSTEDWIMVQADVKNAFNTVARDSMLHNSLAKVPTVYNWLAWSYQKPCPVYSQGKLHTEQNEDPPRGCHGYLESILPSHSPAASLPVPSTATYGAGVSLPVSTTGAY